MRRAWGRLAAYAVALLFLVDSDRGRPPRRARPPAPPAKPPARHAPRAGAAVAPPLPLPLALGRSGLPAGEAAGPVEAALFSIGLPK